MTEPVSELPVQQGPVAVLSQVEKTYHLDSISVPVIRGVNILVRHACFTVLLGPSGSGKTTLLNMIGCIDKPDKGEIIVADHKVGEMTDDELSDFRAKNIGFIFQNFNLLPGLNVYENIEAPFLYRSFDSSRIKERIMESIAQVGLLERIKHKPAELSGGEMQRVAIARAICADPLLVLADEPTGNLDSHTGMDILKIFKKLHNNGSTIILVTHDRHVASIADRTVYLRDGKLIENGIETE